MPVSREEDFYRKNTFPLFDIWPRPSTRTHAQGIIKVTISVDPSLVTKFVWSMSGSREENFLRNTSILHFLPQNYLPLGVGVMTFTISCLLTIQILHTKFDKYWPNSSWEEDVYARRTTYDDGRQPIARVHLSYKGDLKIKRNWDVAISNIETMFIYTTISLSCRSINFYISN